jgi:CheY-like chemotaxis protein
VEQVVMNLAVNARDAMPRGGRLTIETAAASGPDLAVTLSVGDTGIGMDEETRAHLFEPFFTTKEPGKGTGLGLATVYGIVQQSGGRIAVTTAPAAGARFEVTLPAHATSGAAPPPAVPEAPPARGDETVLLVEDEPSVHALVRDVLAESGYRVLAARDGEEAIALFERHAPEIRLVLSDVIMPKMSGPELIARLADPGRARVLFMSGYRDSATALPAGVSYLSKPFTPDALLRAVRDTLDAPAGLIEGSLRSS